MTNRLRAFAWFLALVAIMLRAALPVGWMPIADGAMGTRLVICTGHGPLTDRSRPREQTPLSRHETGICPFAAATHVSSPVPFALLPAPVRDARISDPSVFARTVLLLRRGGDDHPPRGPPAFA
jgi:hypothetical protein